MKHSTKTPHFYLKHGCPDLIGAGIEIARPARLPFLATLVAPPWHRGVDQDLIDLAYRLRDAVAVLILESKWFEVEGIRNNWLGYGTRCRSKLRLRVGLVNLMPPRTRIASPKRWDSWPRVNSPRLGRYEL